LIPDSRKITPSSVLLTASQRAPADSSVFETSTAPCRYASAFTTGITCTRYYGVAARTTSGGLTWIAADHHAADRLALVDLLHPQPNEAVVDQDVVARTEHLADHRRRDGQLAVGRDLLADDEHLFVLQEQTRRLEVADAELRPLQVGDQRERLAALGLHLADRARARSVILVRPV